MRPGCGRLIPERPPRCQIIFKMTRHLTITTTTFRTDPCTGLPGHDSHSSRARAAQSARTHVHAYSDRWVEARCMQRRASPAAFLDMRASNNPLQATPARGGTASRARALTDRWHEIIDDSAQRTDPLTARTPVSRVARPEGGREGVGTRGRRAEINEVSRWSIAESCRPCPRWSSEKGP